MSPFPFLRSSWATPSCEGSPRVRVLLRCVRGVGGLERGNRGVTEPWHRALYKHFPDYDEESTVQNTEAEVDFVENLVTDWRPLAAVH